MKLVPHQQTPSDLAENTNLAAQIVHVKKVSISNVTVVTMKQRTSDWFVGRQWRMTSTSKHSPINVKGAVYLNTTKLRSLHSRELRIMQLHPRNTITTVNTVDLEDKDIPSQRSHQVRIEGVVDQNIVTSDARCISKFWLCGNSNTLAQLRIKCNENGVAFEEKFQRKYLADALSAKFQMDANKRDDALLTVEVPNNDVEANLFAQVAFLQRMVPIWSMRPFTSKCGAIEHGNVHESQVIQVLRNKII